jgi:hypothetical protein
MIPLGFFVFARKWWKLGAGFLVGALVAFPLGQCSGAAGQKKHEQADRAVAIAGAMTANAKASDKAASERVTDALKAAELERKLTDAVAEVSDSAPTVSDVALGCARLREQGDDVSNVPACRGLGGQAQARP